MRQNIRHISQSVLVLLSAVVVALACSQGPVPEPIDTGLQTGTVQAALSTLPNPCPVTGTCVLYPDKDTTVYLGAAKDYGKSHEICVGKVNNGANGVARALLHFDLGQLPAHFFATTASLSMTGRRSPGSRSLSVFRLTSGSWGEGDGTGVADGHTKGGCSTCGGTGACGWNGSGTVNNATFSVTDNVGAATATSTFAVPGTVTFSGLEGDVRTFASSTNFGWSLRSSNESAGPPMVFLSTDTATGDANKPSLSVTYGRGPGASGCSVNSDCFFSNGATGFCAPNHVCCNSACTDSNTCTTEMCDSTGACTHPFNTDPCVDNNDCTTNDKCNGAGVCVGTSITCTALDQCHEAGTCSGGVCSNPIKTNGDHCDDGNSCSSGETCQNGICTGGSGIVCPPADQCHDQAACNNGVCPVNPPKTNGTHCDDGNGCTTGESCQAGVCTAGVGTVCPAADQCHFQSVCANGVCPANPAKPNGTHCEDGNPCSTDETCQAGICSGGTGVVCPPADQCHVQAACSTNGCPTNPPKPDGTPCDDGSECTAFDVCEAGSCEGGLPIPCMPTRDPE
jgi:hypothetical protein